MSKEIYYGGEVEFDPAENAVVHYAPAKDFGRWFDDFTDPWRPVMAQLSKVFGTEFYMQHTGGGCMAIEAVFEGVGIMITSANDVLARFNDHKYGYAVGVYPMTDCDCYTVKGGPKCDHGPYMDSEEPIGWASSPQATSVLRLVTLITMALAQAARDDCDGGWDRRRMGSRRPVRIRQQLIGAGK